MKSTMVDSGWYLWCYAPIKDGRNLQVMDKSVPCKNKFCKLDARTRGICPTNGIRVVFHALLNLSQVAFRFTSSVSSSKYSSCTTTNKKDSNVQVIATSVRPQLFSFCLMDSEYQRSKSIDSLYSYDFRSRFYPSWCFLSLLVFDIHMFSWPAWALEAFPDVINALR